MMVLPLASVATVMVVSPLLMAAVVALGARTLQPRWAHGLTISGMVLAFACATYIAYALLLGGQSSVDTNLYTWLHVGRFHVHIGFLLDQLSAVMCWVVTWIALLVHIYSVGYMQGESGYPRFFALVSLFTFAMLMLVLADNALQLFFGWEGVGVVSYLLIGFWFHKPSAAAGSLKAFIVNRVGDLGLVLGLAACLAAVGSLDYHSIFRAASLLGSQTMALGPLGTCSVAGFIGACMLVGAMGKSAQVPLHVWLPESMEGPTPISALIHAATMVTAGIYLLVRFSPVLEQTPAVLNTILVIGSTGALWLGLVGIVQHDIKRVVAYSTLSQLGYMIAATGASAYSAAMFHLLTHAFFKALLFLGAGSVIIATHHEQDMRKMGALWSRMPITYITFVIGTLALIALPPFAGFFSKDALIDAVHHGALPASTYAYLSLVLGAFVTALYSARCLLLTFHGRCHLAHPDEVHETSWTMCGPLLLLAIPSCIAGWGLSHVLFSSTHAWFAQSVAASARVLSTQHYLVSALANRWHFIREGVLALPCMMTYAGIFTAWVCYVRYPSIPERMVAQYRWVYAALVNKYGFDALNDCFFVVGIRRLAQGLYVGADQCLIDSGLVLGSARSTRWFAQHLRRVQTGHLSHYVLAMVLGLLACLTSMYLI